MKTLKAKKIGSLFAREISEIILEEIKDPHIKFVSITDVDISNDLSFAKVYFTLLNREYKDETLKALNKASGYIERELAHKIEIRKMPKISFIYDTSIEYGEQIEEKIKEIHNKES